MNKEIYLVELMERVRKCNKLYRKGSSVVSDQEYDSYLDELQNLLPEQDFNEFRMTLLDGEGKIQHGYIIGSLNKAKAEEPEEIIKWAKKHKVKEVLVSDKIDGMGLILNYNRGQLISAVTRGDGEKGEDVLDKVKHVPNIPQIIQNKEFKKVRGELTLTKYTFETLKAIEEREYKNPRNATVGVVNHKTINSEHLNLLRFYAFGIVNSKARKESQYKSLRFWGFDIPTVRAFPKVDNYDLTEHLTKRKENAEYLMDGLVIFAPDALNENVYYPEKMIAYKINDEFVETTVIEIEWTTSKTGYVKPVVLLEAVELAGTTVKRATGYNGKYIIDNNIGPGAKVQIIKSGDIIPKIIKVVDENLSASVPALCPSCNGSLEMDGVEIRCNSKKCGVQEVKKVAYFIKQMEVDGASETSLNNWGITNMKKLIKWKPDINYKMQVKFYESLVKKVINADKEDILCSMSYEGGARKTIEKLLEFYGEETLYKMAVTKKLPQSYPVGIGEKVITKVLKDFNTNHKIMLSIMEDERRKLTKKKKAKKVVKKVIGKLTGKSFLITGTLSQPRKYFQNLIKEHGGKVASGPSRNLNYLVAGEKAGSKLEKAKKLGITILTEKKFMNMIK